MKKFLKSNDLKWRLIRTIVQALIGFLIANAAELVAMTNFDGPTQAIIVSATMVILSPAMKLLAEEGEADD